MSLWRKRSVKEKEMTITLTTNKVETINLLEVEIEFKEWIHPQLGVVPVDPKTPLILKAIIREKVVAEFRNGVQE